MTVTMNCPAFDDLAQRIAESEGDCPFLPPDIISGEWYGTWYCKHGLIAMLPAPPNCPSGVPKLPFHNVNPALVGLSFETTSVADGA